MRQIRQIKINPKQMNFIRRMMKPNGSQLP